MTLLTKICLHWTAGSNNPCNTDLKAYHFLIDSRGRIYPGTHKPEDNINCNDGNYAAHCGGGNTGCIGLSVCGMAGFSLIKKQTKYPITQKQVDDALCPLAAYLSIKYGIPVNRIFTHYEFDKTKKKPEGKIDITYLPYLPDLSVQDVLLHLKNKINWYRQKIKAGKYKFEKKGSYYEFTRID